MESYDNLLEKRKVWYENIGKVYCPCLNNDIIFNSKGFNHIKYNGAGKARSKKERMYRLGILPLAIPVIKNAKAVYKYKQPEYSERMNKIVEFWALREVVGKQKIVITVILRKIGSGNITFFSIMKKK